MSREERRRHRRVPMVTKVIHLLADTFQYYYSHDLSLGGIFLETKKPFRIGAELELEFELPGRDQRVRVKGVVARIVDAVPEHHEVVAGMGIEFKYMPAESRAELLAFLSDR